MISVDISFILVVLNFLFLMVVLKKFLYKPLKAFLTERQNFIMSKTEQIKEAEKKALELQKQKQDELSNAMNEIKSLRDKAKKEAEEKAIEIRHEAEERAKKIIQTAEEQILLERKKAMEEISEEIVGMVSELSGKFMAEKFDSKKDEKLIQDLISKKE